MSRFFNESLPDVLQERLQRPLPGKRAQMRGAHEMSYGRHFGPAPRQCRRAAVLVLLRWDGEQWLLPLTRRQQGLGIHSGQICCVGGGIDPNESPRDAALRECREEIGWAPDPGDVVGRLSPLYVYASNNLVDTVLAATHDTPTWQPDPREVAELLEVPLQHLCTPSAFQETKITRHGMATRAPCFRWQGYDIWGATSMILAELVSLLSDPEN